VQYRRRRLGLRSVGDGWSAGGDASASQRAEKKVSGTMPLAMGMWELEIGNKMSGTTLISTPVPPERTDE